LSKKPLTRALTSTRLLASNRPVYSSHSVIFSNTGVATSTGIAATVVSILLASLSADLKARAMLIMASKTARAKTPRAIPLVFKLYVFIFFFFCFCYYSLREQIYIAEVFQG